MSEAKIEKRIRYIQHFSLNPGGNANMIHTFDGDTWFSGDENGAANYPWLMNNSIVWIEERLVYEPGEWEPVDLDKHLAGVETVEPDYSNLVLTREQLIDQLKARQHQLCAYATTEGDGKACDCKYNPLPGIIPSRGEMTGCPELRQAIRALVTLT